MMSPFDNGLTVGIYGAFAFDHAYDIYKDERKSGKTPGVSLILGTIAGALWPVIILIGLFIKDEKKPKKN